MNRPGTGVLGVLVQRVLYARLSSHMPRKSWVFAVARRGRRAPRAREIGGLFFMPRDESRGEDDVMDILYRLDRERVYSHLVRCLSDRDDAIREGALELLGSYGEKVTHLLIPLLQSDPSPDVRSGAAAMLGYVGTREAIPALKWAAEHDDEEDIQESKVSSYAKHAIKQIKYRYGRGAGTYDPLGPRSLAEENLIEELEDLD